MKKILIILTIGISLFSCKKEFDNYNNVTEEIAYKTAEAYPGIIMGMTKEFVVNSYYEIVRGPGLTAHELGSINTFLTEPQLEEGGPALPPDNSSVSFLFKYLHSNRNISEKVLENIDDVQFIKPLNKIAFKNYAKFMNAITTGYMAQYWEKVTLKNNSENQATYVDRENGLQHSIDILSEVINDLNNNPGADEIINNLISDEFSFINVLYAFKARYEIELGQYQNAYNDANNVDISIPSVWTYDGIKTKNTIYNHTLETTADKRFRPIDSLGLINQQMPELNDKRNSFYLDYKPNHSSYVSHYQVDDPKGFWDTADKNIPVYLPGEMILIKAEAKARMGGANLAEAVSLINQIRQKSQASDIFGVGAELGPWTGDATNQQEVLDEIYKNYAIELFMQGQRWPIHRRFYPHYLDGINWNTVDVYTLERVNNFYPYPDQERSNNPNCPPDPEY